MAFKTFIKYDLYVRGLLDKKDGFKLIQKNKEFQGINTHTNEVDAQKELDGMLEMLKTPYPCSKIEIIQAEVKQIA